MKKTVEGYAFWDGDNGDITVASFEMAGKHCVHDLVLQQALAEILIAHNNDAVPVRISVETL